VLVSHLKRCRERLGCARDSAKRRQGHAGLSWRKYKIVVPQFGELSPEPAIVERPGD
jgi:hypothetical protein